MNSLIVRTSQKEIQETLGLRYCHMGCGLIAQFYSKQLGTWRCSKYPQQCQVRKIKNSALKKGCASPMKGKKHSPEAMLKIIKANRGRGPLPEKTKVKMSQAKIGKKKSEQTKLKMSNYSKSRSKEHLAKLSKTTSDYLIKFGGFTGGNNLVEVFLVNNINGDYFKLQGTYEKRTAEFLNSKNILWTRGKRFRYILNGGSHFYTPDFYLPYFDIYLETKGWFQDKDKLKMKLVLEQNDIRLFMIFEKDIKNLNKFFESIINENGDRSYPAAVDS